MRVDYAYDPTVTTDTMSKETAALDEALDFAITDGEPDFFTSLFEEKSVDIEVGETETVKEETEDDKKTTPIEVTPSKDTQMVVEEVVIAPEMEEITEKTAQEDKVFENNDEKQVDNHPKIITTAYIIKSALFYIGTKVKEIWGNVVKSITGNNDNNAGTNNQSGSSNAGQNKPVQEINNIVPTAVLDIKQAQQAVKAAEEAKKEAKKEVESKATEDIIQNDSELGG